MEPAVTHLRPPGAASTVVLWLHGFQSDQAGEKAAFFRERMLASGRAFASFDFRGHGRTGGSLRDLTGTGLLEDVERASAPLAAGYRSLVIVGSSMGGWAAAWHAAKHPGRVAALVLIAPALRFPATIVERVGPGAAERWEREGTLTVDNGYGPATLSWALVEDGRFYPPGDLLELHATPTLILHGMRDDACDWRRSLEFAERSRAPVDLVLYGDGDHRLTDRKERLAEAVESFLRSRGV